MNTVIDRPLNSNAAIATTATTATVATRAAAASAAPAAAITRRMDLYTTIHKAVRHLLGDTLLRVGAMDPGDDGDRDAVLAQLDGLIALLHGHLQHENQFVHPALEARQPGSARRIAQEHDEHRAALEALAADGAALRTAAADEREHLALRLYRQLALFMAENLQHMHIEETAHNTVLWAAYSDAELLALHQRLMSSVAPQEMTQVLHWMAPALSHAELVAVLVDMLHAMPSQAFDAILFQVQQRLPTPRWSKLARALKVPQQPGLVDFGQD